MIVFYYNDNKQNNNNAVKAEEIDRILSHIEKASDSNISKASDSNISKASDSNISDKQCEIDISVKETGEHITNNFSKNLRILRKFSKLKQEDIEEKTNISHHAIASYEIGRREPTAKNLCLIAKLFNVNPMYLMEKDLSKHNYLLVVSKNNSFAENLKIIRNSLEMTQEEFAYYTGLTLKSVINYENKVHLPDYSSLKILAEKLIIDPFELVGTGK